jgi:hypothetical protein
MLGTLCDGLQDGNKKKANTVFAFASVVVGAEGLEPPTYAL